MQAISHSDDVKHEFMLAGHNAFRFKDDPFNANGHVPTVAGLIARMRKGD